MKLTFDQIASNALEKMENTMENIFLTGKAGTGKSTLLRHFLENTKKNVAVVAPTGVAALNVGGSTIHSFFRLAPTITVQEAKKDGKKSQNKEIYTKLETLIIDEISMVRADLLDCIDVFLSEARVSKKKFGGVQMIFIGDLYQLPPVVTSNEKGFFDSIYSSPYFFDSKVISGGKFKMDFIELEKIYRQNDKKFVEILNAIRNKSINDNQIKLLNKNVIEDEIVIEDGNIYLTGTNAKADEINTKELRNLKGKNKIFQAEISGKFEKRQYPTDEYLKLKVGAQVMFVANGKLGMRVNGTVGKILEINDEDVVVQIYGGDIVEVGYYTWNVKKYVYNKSNGKLSTEKIGSFTQIPLVLAWGITIHKSQGKTFNKSIIDLGRGTFAHGQAYVALSRCTSLQGLQLVKPISKSHILMDWKVIDFVTRFQYAKSDENLSIENKIELLKKAIKDGKSLKIVYLKSQDIKSKRTIRPYEVGEMYYNGKKFLGLSCFCEVRKEDRVFRVDRILEMDLL